VRMVTLHKVMIFVPYCNSTLWNTGSTKNLTLTITFLRQCEYLSTGRSFPVFARLTAWWRRHFIVVLVAWVLQK
jgi:hypothetical protein